MSRHVAAVWGIRVLILGVLLATWAVLSYRDGGLFLPSVSDTLTAWWEQLHSSEFWSALWASNKAILIGFPISVVVGLPLGLMLGRVRAADRLFSQYLDFSMVLPMVALVPIVIVALGLSLTARVAVVILFTLPVVAMNARGRRTRHRP